MLDLFQLDYFLLVQNFHGIEFFGSFVLNQHHPTEGTRSQGLETIKVVKCRTALKTQEVKTNQSTQQNMKAISLNSISDGRYSVCNGRNNGSNELTP